MDLYVHLTYKEYKVLEKAMREFKETTHKTVTGFYHKSIRIPVGNSEFEFHGPAPKAMESPPVDEHVDRRKGKRRTRFDPNLAEQGRRIHIGRRKNV